MTLSIGRAPRLLEACLALPAGPVRGGAVVCHPHPQYGGDMDDPVVLSMAGALGATGHAVLRFNFGGVGRSQGTAGGGPDEIADAAHALDALIARVPADVPLVLAGYSFGAWVALELAARAHARVTTVVAVAPPLAYFAWDGLDRVTTRVAFVVGDRDQFCPPDRLASVCAAHPAIAVRRLAGADHFLAGREAAVAEAVRALCAALNLRD